MIIIFFSGGFAFLLLPDTRRYKPGIILISQSRDSLTSGVMRIWTSAPGDSRHKVVSGQVFSFFQQGQRDVLCSVPFADRSIFPACLFTEAKASALVLWRGPRFVALFCTGSKLSATVPLEAVNLSNSWLLGISFAPKQQFSSTVPNYLCGFGLLFFCPLGIS